MDLPGHVRGLSLVLTLAVFCGLGPLAAPAVADPARARAHFEVARRYVQVDEYRKAIEEFKAAHVEEPDPAFLYNIAECHRHLGEGKDALVYYRRFLSLAAPNAPSRVNAEKRIAELQATRDAPVPLSTAPAMRPAPAAIPPPPPPAPAPAPEKSQPRPVLTARAPVEPAPSAAVVVTAPRAVTLGATPEEASPVAEAAPSRPFYKSGWFFVALGGALVAGTVGVWALSSGGGDKTIPETPLGNQSAFR
jgi:hypothetical protein